MAFSYTIDAQHDEITSLPATDDLRSRQFSGYLQLSSTKLIHYYFIESESDPSVDPVVFWTNGGLYYKLNHIHISCDILGPGCSGLLALFTGYQLVFTFVTLLV